MTKEQARIMYDYYTDLIQKLMEAKLKLTEGGVKSYTIGDRNLTRFDIDTLGKEIDDYLKKQAECLAILQGRSVRKAVGVIPRDF